MTKEDFFFAAELRDRLNALLTTEEGREIVDALYASRVQVSAAAGEHPTIQARSSGEGASVSLVGLLNGAIGVYSNGWGALAVKLKSGRVQSFHVRQENGEYE